MNIQLSNKDRKALNQAIDVIDITPTWSNIADALLLLLEKGDTVGKAHAEKEIKRMAKLADLYCEGVKK